MTVNELERYISDLILLGHGCQVLELKIKSGICFFGSHQLCV